MSSLRKFRKDIPLSRNLLNNPFADIHHRIDKAMSDYYSLFEQSASNIGQFEDLLLSPAIDFVDDENCYKVVAELPGIDEKDVHVSIDNNILTISAEKSLSKKDQAKSYLMREISYGKYERSVTLPENLDYDKTCASFKKGMLWVEIPKRAKDKIKTRHIQVEKAKE